MTTKNRPGRHADGYAWHKNMISNHRSHTLVNPDGHPVAHIVQVNDGTWSVADEGDGGYIVDRLLTAGDAMRIADNVYRPCAHPPCDLDRAPQSIYCPQHTEGA